MEGERRFRAKRGKFYIHVGTETMVCCWGISSPKQPTGDTLDITGLNMQAGGGGEADSRRPQHLTSTTEGPTRGGSCDHHHEPWALISVTEFHSKTEVMSRGRLYGEDTKRRETYLGKRVLYTRYKTVRFLQCGD